MKRARDLAHALVAWIICAVCIGCAQTHSISTRAPDEQFKIIENGSTPFTIDLASPSPFSRYAIPWPDEETAGLDVTWLRAPAQAELPPFLLVVNEYTRNRGLLCLIERDGTVSGSVDSLGLIQRVQLVSIAPVAAPQLLVYANTGHGTGAVLSDLVLLEFTSSKLKELLRTPRFEYASRAADECVLPFALQQLPTGRVIVVALTITQDDKGTISGEPRYLEFEWDKALHRYREAASPTFRPIVASDAWTWLAEYDRGSTN